MEPLVAVLKDKDMVVQEAAAKALGRIGDKRAVMPLVTCARDRAVAKTAIRALRQVLEVAITDIAPKNLRAVALLNNVVQAELVSATFYTYGCQLGDCSLVRQLAQQVGQFARQELSRRGLELLGRV